MHLSFPTQLRLYNYAKSLCWNKLEGEAADFSCEPDFATVIRE